MSSQEVGRLNRFLEGVNGRLMALDSISDEEFIEVWQSSQTVSQATGLMAVLSGHVLRPSDVRSRASSYRREGVRLKRM